MSLHSYSRVWLHLVWATVERRPLLPKPAAVKVSDYLSRYAPEKAMYMKINFVNPDHVHVPVDLPAQLCIEEMVQLFKGSSSHWINHSNLLPCKFAWGRGRGVFSVSHSLFSLSPSDGERAGVRGRARPCCHRVFSLSPPDSPRCRAVAAGGERAG